jgi:putative DNA primase/helicase
MSDQDLFASIEPYSEPVNGGQLLTELSESATRFMTLPEHGDTILALWSVFSHAHDAAHHSPLLAVTAPEKRCGKTTVLAWLSKLVNRPLSASNITGPALYRTIDLHEPTILIDEADTFLRDRDDLRGILNSGHSRIGTVIRLVGSDYTPQQFNTWCPKAIAMIGNLPDTLSDRSIHLKMRRKLPHEGVERMRGQEHHFNILSQKIARFVADNIDPIRNANPVIPQALNDRAADNWHVLLSIALVAGGNWYKKAISAAESFIDSEVNGGGINEELLTDIKTVFEDANTDRLQTTMLIEHLYDIEEAPWKTWNRGNPLTARQLATRLKNFGITTNQTIRIGGMTCKGYRLDQFRDAFERYTPPVSVTESQASEYEVYSLDAISNMYQDVTDNKTFNPNDYNGCDRVTDKSRLKEVCQRCDGEGCGYCAL